MSTFDERENAFEAKYAHDAEMQFKAEARRNRKLALWAAEKMGMSSAETETYVAAVIVSDLEEEGSEDVFRKVMGDLQNKHSDVTEEELRAKITELSVAAKQELMNEP